MGKRFQQLFALFVIISLVGIVTTTVTYAEKFVSEHSLKQTELRKPEIPDKLVRFSFDSGFNFEYPDAVRGIYVTGHSAGGERLNSLIDLLDRTDLNTMVIDIKDDFGYLTYVPDEKSPYKDISQRYIKDPAELMCMIKRKIYP